LRGGGRSDKDSEVKRDEVAGYRVKRESKEEPEILSRAYKKGAVGRKNLTCGETAQQLILSGREAGQKGERKSREKEKT